MCYSQLFQVQLKPIAMASIIRILEVFDYWAKYFFKIKYFCDFFYFFFIEFYNILRWGFWTSNLLIEGTCKLPLSHGNLSVSLDSVVCNILWIILLNFGLEYSFKSNDVVIEFSFMSIADFTEFEHKISYSDTMLNYHSTQKLKLLNKFTLYQYFILELCSAES